MKVVRLAEWALCSVQPAAVHAKHMKKSGIPFHAGLGSALDLRDAGMDSALDLVDAGGGGGARGERVSGTGGGERRGGGANL